MIRNKLHLLKVVLSYAIVLLIAALLVGLSFSATSARAGGWHIETVDSEGQVGYYTSLTLDGGGYPHISYCGSYDLKYAYQDASGWHIQAVDSEEGVGMFTSLALDEDGYPHISYDGGYPASLKYAYQDASGWHIQTVDTELGSWGGHTSLALDGGGYPHISYRGDGLKYAYQDASGWHIEAVDSKGDVGLYTSLALDEDGYPHISYYDVTNDDLKYAYQDASGWHIQTVDSDGGGYTSLALDGGGYPHISYSGSGLKYAYQDSSGWHTETLDGGRHWEWVGWYTSLALDGDGYSHISYFHYTDADLRYAYQIGSDWHIEAVDSEGRVGEFTSLALDAGGYPHISYLDWDNWHLKYAYYGPRLKWRDPHRPLLLPARGATVDVAYGNITTPATLTATLTGPAVFADGSQELTVNITEASGSHTLHLKPAACATPGATFTLEVALAGRQLEREGTIAWELYLPLIFKAYQFDRLTYDPANDSQPALSPDGQTVVFISDRDGPSDVFSIPVRGGQPANLTQTPSAQEDTPIFSPDGSVIAFASDRDGDWNIYLMDTDGTNVRPALDDYTGTDELHPAFTPDGLGLVFSSDRADGNWDIYTATIGSNTWTRLTTHPAADRFPNLSADGRTIVFRSERDGNSEIYLMNADGSNLRRVTNDPAFDGYPSITPDGSGVIFVSNRSCAQNVYVVNLAGEGLTALEQRPGWQMDTPRLSSDGRLLLYAGGPTHSTFDIYKRKFVSPLMLIAQRGADNLQDHCDWEAGVLAYGWIHAWQATQDDQYRRWAQEWVDACIPIRTEITHVNDGLLGYAALIAYETSGQPEYLSLAQRVADYLMNTAPRTADGTLTHDSDRVWVDTLLGAVPFLIEMSQVSGNDIYADEAISQVIQHADHLQNPVNGLYYHAWDESQDDFFGPVYWGRGNGWALLADVEVLSAMTTAHALRSPVLNTMQEQAVALKPLQDPGGLWPTVVTRPDFYLETSASAVIGYAFRRGVQEGWLNENAYSPAAQAAMLGVWRKVLADGTVTVVSAPTGPMATEEEYNAIPHDTLQLYGQGAALLLESPNLP